MGQGNCSRSDSEGTGGYVGAFPSATTPLDLRRADVEHGMSWEVGAVPYGLHPGDGMSSIQECACPGPHAKLG